MRRFAFLLLCATVLLLPKPSLVDQIYAVLRSDFQEARITHVYSYRPSPSDDARLEAIFPGAPVDLPTMSIQELPDGSDVILKEGTALAVHQQGVDFIRRRLELRGAPLSLAFTKVAD